MPLKIWQKSSLSNIPPKSPSGPNNPQLSEYLAISTRTQTNWSGPIPPPEVLEKYNQILPGMAQRILAMAEKQSDHRQKVEVAVIKSDIVKSYLGMIFATIIVLFGMAVAALIAVLGNSANSKILAAFIVAFDFGAVVLIAVNNKKSQTRQLDKRRDSSLNPPQ